MSKKCKSSNGAIFSTIYDLACRGLPLAGSLEGSRGSGQRFLFTFLVPQWGLFSAEMRRGKKRDAHDVGSPRPAGRDGRYQLFG